MVESVTTDNKGVGYFDNFIAVDQVFRFRENAILIRD